MAPDGKKKKFDKGLEVFRAQVAFIFERVRIRLARQREKQPVIVIGPKTSASGFPTFSLKNPRGFQLRRLRGPRALSVAGQDACALINYRVSIQSLS